MKIKYDIAYTANKRIELPDIQITRDKFEYNYVPLRGYSACLAVFDIDDKCIGWIDTRTLGYENVKEWMDKTKWVDTGY